MYIEGSQAYLYHLAHYGHPSVFGYKDIIQLWKAQNFDPDRLMALYKDAGAKYFVAQANHHDNFDNWDSKYHEWNSVNYGPHKNIVGLWRDAALKAGLRFGITTHAERTWSWFQTNKGADKNGPYKGVPYDGNDRRYQHLYLPKDPTGDTDPLQAKNAPPEWRQEWLARIDDVVNRYHPDMMYVDGGVPFRGDDQGQTGLRMIANLYNGSIKDHNGTNEAVMCAKKNRPGLWSDGIVTRDCEHLVIEDGHDQPWQTDDSIGPWFYNDKIVYDMTGGKVIRKLIDIVSKNGNLLLNVPQRPDGSIDPAAEKELASIGAWLKINGEAIYATRPWKISGEGPDLQNGQPMPRPAGGSQQRKNPVANKVLTSEDIRFTQSKDGKTLYAITLGWPKDGKIIVKSLAAGVGKINEVSLLGDTGKLDWQQTTSGLVITTPKEKPVGLDSAYSFKILGENLK